MKIDVISSNGGSTGRQVELDDGIFGIEPNDHSIYLAVKQYLANQRQGTHKSKERGEITGSRKKLKKQKGTGTARFGDIKNPIFRGGGRAFGPRPRDYSFKLNKKVKKLARNSALSYKAKGSNVFIMDALNFDQPKTKDFVAMLKNLSLDQKKTLFVLKDSNVNFQRSAQNVQKAKVTRVSDLNTYDILNANTLIFVEEAVADIS